MSKSTRRRSMARDRARLQQVGGEWTPGISDEARAAEGWRALDIGGAPCYTLPVGVEQSGSSSGS